MTMFTNEWEEGMQQCSVDMVSKCEQCCQSFFFGSSNVSPFSVMFTYETSRCHARVSGTIHDSLRPQVIDDCRRKFSLNGYGITTLDKIPHPLPLGHPWVFGAHHGNNAFKRWACASVHRLTIILELQKSVTVITAVDFKLVKGFNQWTQETGAKVSQRIWDHI